MAKRSKSKATAGVRNGDRPNGKAWKKKTAALLAKGVDPSTGKPKKAA